MTTVGQQEIIEDIWARWIRANRGEREEKTDGWRQEAA